MRKVLIAIVTLAWSAVPGLLAQTAEVPWFWAYLRSPAQPESWVVAELRVLRDASRALDSGTRHAALAVAVPPHVRMRVIR